MRIENLVTSQVHVDSDSQVLRFKGKQTKGITQVLPNSFFNGWNSKKNLSISLPMFYLRLWPASSGIAKHCQGWFSQKSSWNVLVTKQTINVSIANPLKLMSRWKVVSSVCPCNKKTANGDFFRKKSLIHDGLFSQKKNAFFDWCGLTRPFFY